MANRPYANLGRDAQAKCPRRTGTVLNPIVHTIGPIVLRTDHFKGTQWGCDGGERELF
jgi:hypothetical protein